LKEEIVRLMSQQNQGLNLTQKKMCAKVGDVNRYTVAVLAKNETAQTPSQRDNKQIISVSSLFQLALWLPLKALFPR
jgi:hypothetical protein